MWSQIPPSPREHICHVSILSKLCLCKIVNVIKYQHSTAHCICYIIGVVTCDQPKLAIVSCKGIDMPYSTLLTVNYNALLAVKVICPLCTISCEGGC